MIIRERSIIPLNEEGRDYLELRAEWMKMRGCLWDANTGLPTLPGVIEDVRRYAESGVRIGVIVLDFSSEEHIEEIYGWETYDGVLTQVSRALEGLRGSVLGERDLVALQGVRSDQFLLFLGLESSMPEIELGRLRDQVISELSQLLRIQVGREHERGLGLYAGSGLVPYDPTTRIERSIYRAVENVRVNCWQDREEQLNSRLAELRRILTWRDVRIRYQPIVWLSNSSIFGYEALSCGPAGNVFENPEMMFAFAERTDQILSLEHLCRTEAIRGATRLPEGRKLFLNTSVHGFEDLVPFPDSLRRELGRAGLEPSDLVLEITERVAVKGWKEFRKRLDSLREEGVAVAIDDMGAGYSSLQSVAELEPDFLKFDLNLVRDIHASPIKQGLLESLLLMAQRIDAQVIAEGVEQAEEFEALRDMRVTFGQGYLFSPPDSLEFHIPADVTV